MIFPLMMIPWGLFSVLVGSVFVHVGVYLVVGENRKNFQATFRVLSYAEAPAVFSWLPVVGLILSLYTVVLGVIGIKKVHETTLKKALLAYFIFIILIGGLIVALAVLLAVVSSMLGGGQGI